VKRIFWVFANGTTTDQCVENEDIGIVNLGENFDGVR